MVARLPSFVLVAGLLALVERSLQAQSLQPALFDTEHVCCPNGSYITEFEATLKTFKAPKPFDDGQFRSLNGTLLHTNFSTTFLRSGVGNDILKFFDWNYPSARSNSGPPSWDDVQGLALTVLHNVTILGSLQAKCSLKNGTVVAALPRIGSNLTKDCFAPPGLEVKESKAIRILNSTFADGSFTSIFVNAELNIPTRYAASQTHHRDPVTLNYGHQEKLYQDFMGLMRLLNITAENAPETVDVATLDWTTVPLFHPRLSSLMESGMRSETILVLETWFAVRGFTGFAGCYGPRDLQIFAERKTLDVAPIPGSEDAGPTSYSNCSHAKEWNSSDPTYVVLAGYNKALERLTYERDGFFANSDRFLETPLACCPEGEYIKAFDLEFSGNPVYLQKEPNGSFAKHLWGITGICSQGTRLPTVSGGNGCTRREELLPASTYAAVEVEYDNINWGSNSELEYRADGEGILVFAGAGPNASALPGYKSWEIIGEYGSSKENRSRIVGLDATASCTALASIGLVLRTVEQINEPKEIRSSLSGTARIVLLVITVIVISSYAIRTSNKRWKRQVVAGVETQPLSTLQRTSIAAFEVSRSNIHS